MDVVAILGLARSIEDEAPLLAADLGLTTYETAVMLRAPPPVIIARSDDRSRTMSILGKIRARGHDAVACDLDSVTWSEDMFRPKSFRFEGGDFVGVGSGEERRLPMSNIFAMLRAIHATRTEDVVEQQERKLSFGRAALTGGLLTTRTHTTESRRVTLEREPVLYLFPMDASPWLLASTFMRYDGLASEMQRSRHENFEILLRILRDAAPNATFDTRLVAVRASTNVISSGFKHVMASSSGTLDILAHVIAASLSAAARPYR